jgi:hypothetical protein
MPKQQKSENKSLEVKTAEALEVLIKQREQAKATWERCSGAIEVLQSLLEEK